jgi:hypothetical protein
MPGLLWISVSLPYNRDLGICISLDGADAALEAIGINWEQLKEVLDCPRLRGVAR